MPRILSIPDVHGTHNWEKVKTISKDSYDYVVFHGDYFDSSNNKWPDQGENFKAICNFVREDTKHRKLLIGNHDWSYLSGTTDGAYLTDYQNEHALEIKKLLKDNLDILDLAFECDGWVYSHAGFSVTWVQTIKKCLHQLLDEYSEGNSETPSEVWDEEMFDVDFLNFIWHKLNHSNEDFEWLVFDKLLDWYGSSDESGDEVSQGPLWIRPHSLLKDSYFPKQVVSHTEICLKEKVYWYHQEKKIVFVDSVNHDILEPFDTTIDYLDTSDAFPGVVLKKSRSKLPVNLYLDEGGQWLQSVYDFPRIMFQKNRNDSFNIDALIHMSISQNPEVLYEDEKEMDIELDENDINKIKEFVIRNCDLLMRINKDEIDFIDFISDMKIV